MTPSPLPPPSHTHRDSKKAAVCQNHYLQYFSICCLPDSADWTIQSRCGLASDIEQIKLLLCGADPLAEQMLSGRLWLSGHQMNPRYHTYKTLRLHKHNWKSFTWVIAKADAPDAQVKTGVDRRFKENCFVAYKVSIVAVCYYWFFNKSWHKWRLQ